MTAKSTGAGRAVYFGFQPFVIKAVPDAQWRTFFTGLIEDLGTPVGFDIWRFRFPDRVVWQEPLLPGVCVTNNRIVWREEKLQDQNNLDVNGVYSYSISPDRYPDVVAKGEISFDQGRLTDRRRSILAKKTEPKAYVLYELPDSDWMVSWTRTDPVAIDIDIREARIPMELRLWYRDSMPTVTVEGSDDGDRWRPLDADGVGADGDEQAADVVYSRPPHHVADAAEAVETGDVYDFVIEFDAADAYRYVRANFAERRPGTRLSIVEMELWCKDGAE